MTHWTNAFMTLLINHSCTITVSHNSSWNAKRDLACELIRPVLDSFDSTLIISFWSTFKLAYDMNGIRKGTVVWLSHLFVKKSSASFQRSRKFQSSASYKRSRERTLTTHRKVVHYVLKTNSTGNAITKEGRWDPLLYTAANMMPTDYANALLNEAICCDRMQFEYVLQGLFIQG